MKRRIYLHAYGSWGQKYYVYEATFDNPPNLDRYFEETNKATRVIMKQHGEKTIVRHMVPMEVENELKTKRKKESDFAEIKIKEK